MILPLFNRRLILPALLVLAAPADAASVEVAEGSVSVTDTTPATLNFPVSRTGGDDRFPLWLRYQTEDDTALAGQDYSEAKGQFKLPAGSNSANLPVTVSGASGYSADKAFNLKVSGAMATGPAPVFAASRNYSTGQLPTESTSVDLNGDGRQDLVVADTYGDSLSVFLNTASPGASSSGFAAAQTIGVGSPDSVTRADVNGDGRPDLLAANGDDDALTVWINATPAGASTVSFSSAVSFPAGPSVGAVITADVNRDGRPDAILTNDGAVNNPDTTVAVLLNTTAAGASSASFASRQLFTVGSYPRAVAAVDINADDNLDLVVANARSHNLSVLLNTTAAGDSAASFTGQHTVAAGQSPGSLAARDMNGDGRPDLISADEWDDQLSIWVNTTDAGPAEGSGAVAPAFHARQTVATGPDPVWVTAGDINADGKPDLAVANKGNDSVTLLANSTVPGDTELSFGNRRTLATGARPFSVMLAAVNGDGKPDLVVTNGSGNTVSVRLNAVAAPEGLPPLNNGGTTYVPGSTSRVITDDLDGDGRPDLTSMTGSGYVISQINQTELGSRTPTLGERTITPLEDSEGSNLLTMADVNNDGKADLVLTSTGFHDVRGGTWTFGSIQVMLNTTGPADTTSSFGERWILFQNGLGPTRVSVRDMNSDNKPDLVFSQRGPNRLVVCLNTTEPGDSKASFAPVQTFDVPGYGVEQIATPDLNGDGKADVIMREPTPRQFGVRLNTTPAGSTSVSFASGQTVSSNGYPDEFAMTDVNLDGKKDIVVAMDATNEIDVRLNTTAAGATSASFASPQRFATDIRPRQVSIGDLNGDGRPDVITNNDGDYAISATLSVLMNYTVPGSTSVDYQNARTFTPNQDLFARKVTVADMNGDGAADLLMPLALGLLNSYTDFYFNDQFQASITPATVTGTIRYAIAALSLSTNSLDVGSVAVGASATRSVTLSNSGGASLTFNDIQITGADAQDFAQSGSCTGSLAAGASCDIALTYSPAALTTDNAVLTVASTAPGSPHSIALQGRGSNEAPTAADGVVHTSRADSVSGNLDASDPNPGQTLTYQVVASPNFGRVNLTNPTTGAFTYTPADDFTGSDAFTFKVSDGSEESNTARVLIHVGSDNPLADTSEKGGIARAEWLLLVAALGVMRRRRRPGRH